MAAPADKCAQPSVSLAGSSYHPDSSAAMNAPASSSREQLSAAQRLEALRDTLLLCRVDRRTRGLVKECALGGMKRELLATPGMSEGRVAGLRYGEAAALLWRVLRLESGGGSESSYRCRAACQRRATC